MRTKLVLLFLILCLSGNQSQAKMIVRTLIMEAIRSQLKVPGVGLPTLGLCIMKMRKALLIKHI